VAPALYAYGTQIYYQAYKLSNSTSSTAYVEIKGKVTTLYGNFTVPNGTVEVVVNNGATNVYTINVSVKNGVFSSPALSLSPTTNYTYKLVYYNGSKEVLSSNASGTNVEFSGTPSSFATLTVASTSSTTTSTSTSTTTTTINPFYIFLGLVALVIIIVAIVAVGRSTKHAIEETVRKYVKEDRGGYVSEG
jgi:flagellar hook assembly protein FlgD